MSNRFLVYSFHLPLFPFDLPHVCVLSYHVTQDWIQQVGYALILSDSYVGEPEKEGKNTLC